MIGLKRYSEPYSPTGGLAAEGVLNQLGRPDIEPLEVLIREAIQNCWDAKREDERGIQVEVGRRLLNAEAAQHVRGRILTDPPPGLPLGSQLRSGLQLLHFADFGTSGLGGPTRADHAADGSVRDFVDFVRNIGQPPDKELGGGSYGYGKAAFFIASAAKTILIDTLCDTGTGLERRFIGCALGDNFESGNRPFTGRHWWGRLVDGVPEPLTGEDATSAADMLELPHREGKAGLGTTVVIVAPNVAPESADGADTTMGFLVEALAWNFWPRIIATPGGAHSTMSFRVHDQGRPVRLPDPRTHDRLRGFVEAMDRLRAEPVDHDGLVIDRPIDCLRPIKRLGRLVIQKGPVAPVTLPERGVPQGVRQTASSVHHIALMRNAELVVRYLRGAEPASGRFGYSGVFRCALDVDAAFRQAEPPTHDDWVYRAVPEAHDRTFVKVALERIGRACRDAAGFDAAPGAPAAGEDIPLGEFADALATLMPALEGPGARRAQGARPTIRRPRRHAPGHTIASDAAAEVWVDGASSGGGQGGPTFSEDDAPGRDPATASVRPPQVRPGGDPRPSLSLDGAAVIQYPFEVRAHGARVRLAATVEVMTNDGAQVETDAPQGYEPPPVTAWIDPAGTQHPGRDLVAGPEGVDGRWLAEVPISDETMMRVDISAEIA